MLARGNTRSQGEHSRSGSFATRVVLIDESLTPVQRDPVGCQVVLSDWNSVYDDVTWTDPTELQIDHVVALSEAWDSGAWGWPGARRIAFGNDLEDPRSLRAVTGSVNGDEGAADPANWLPPRGPFVCQYLADWVAIKARLELSMDQSEHGRIGKLLTERCPGQLIEAWPDTPLALRPTPPVGVPPATHTAAPAAAPATNLAADVAERQLRPGLSRRMHPPTATHLDVGDISERRFTLLPPDPNGFDGNDNDGIGCES